MNVLHKMAPGRGARSPRSFARFVLALWLLFLGSSSPAQPQQPLSLSELSGGHGIALSDRTRAGAAALAQAREKIEGGETAGVESLLEVARGAELIRDQIDITEIEWLLAIEAPERALRRIQEIQATRPNSRLRIRLDRLAGRGWLAQGNALAAEAAWGRALAAESDPIRRADLKLEMVRSFQAAGELPRDASAADLSQEVLAENSRPEELSEANRTPQMARAAGDALLARGRSEAAADAYAEALRGQWTAEERRAMSHQRGLALFRIRRYKESRDAFEAAGDGPEAHHWLARSHARAGDVPSAMKIFAELGDHESGAVASRALYLLGSLQAGRDLKPEARATFERVAEFTAFPSRAREALWRLGWAAFLRGDFTEANLRLEAMIASSEAEGESLASTRRPRYWAARASEASGDTARATRQYQRLVEQSPLDYYGFRAQGRLGRSEVKASATATPLDPGEIEALPYWKLQRAALLSDAGLPEVASAELRALSHQPLSLGDRLAVGRLMVAVEDYFAAERIVLDALGTPLYEGVRPGHERIWWLAFPRAYSSDVSTGSQHGVDPELIWAIMREESSFRPRIQSSAGAVGLMQLMPGTAARVADKAGMAAPEVADLERPPVNIELGSRYLGELMGRMGGSPSATIASYNAGPLAVARWRTDDPNPEDDDVWVESIPYGQTRAYAKRVLRSYWLYQRLYD